MCENTGAFQLPNDHFGAPTQHCCSIDQGSHQECSKQGSPVSGQGALGQDSASRGADVGSNGEIAASTKETNQFNDSISLPSALGDTTKTIGGLTSLLQPLDVSVNEKLLEWLAASGSAIKRSGALPQFVTVLDECPVRATKVARTHT